MARRIEVQKLRLLPLAVLTAVFVSGCSTSGYDTMATSSTGPSAPLETTQSPNSEMVTDDRTGYVSRRIR
jgi:hypothetical protein